VSDLDVVVEGDAGTLALRAANLQGGEVLIHAPFLTARWSPPKRMAVDLTTARRETYPSPAALPEVEAADLDTDLLRRDFTINSMALCLDPDRLGTLRCASNALKDLDSGLIRVHHRRSFLDDPCRAWRAARFAARLKFSLHPETRLHLQDTVAKDGLRSLGLERKGAEIQAVLEEDRVSDCIRLLEEWEVLPSLHPDARATSEFMLNLNHVLESLEHFAEQGWPMPGSLPVLWQLLGSLLHQEDREAMVDLVPGDKHDRARWTDGPRQLKEALTHLDSATNRTEAGRLLRPLDPSTRVLLWALGRDARSRKWLAWWEREGRVVQTSVDGQLLQSLGHPPGPSFRKALEAARDAAWSGGDEDDQLEAALKSLELP
jgi:tRNA nucleotidyltransferase (CCA-adding enzyme)